MQQDWKPIFAKTWHNISSIQMCTSSAIGVDKIDSIQQVVDACYGDCLHRVFETHHIVGLRHSKLTQQMAKVGSWFAGKVKPVLTEAPGQTSAVQVAW